MYVRGYLQDSENGRVVTIDRYICNYHSLFMLCVAANDCGEDERYCTIDNTCIPGFFWCDAYYVPDCTDGEDEKDCSGMCIYGYYRFDASYTDRNYDTYC